jgi:hypothetical protein
MPDYSKGKIYTIRCRTDDDLIYVGSTIQSLSTRFAKHRSNEKVSLYKYINENCNGDWSNWYIELYELCSCNSKMELEKREGELIREISTINRKIAGRTGKEYRNDNKEILKENRNEYYQENIEKILENKKIYYIENKETINEKRKDKFVCECGCEISKSSLSIHRKSKKHQDLIANIIIAE